MNWERDGCFRGFSAGLHPQGKPHPFTIDLLKRLNYDTSQFRSKSWDEFAASGAAKMNFIFTICDRPAAETCPFWPRAADGGAFWPARPCGGGRQ
jgi:arsenate reductase